MLNALLRTRVGPLWLLAALLLSGCPAPTRVVGPCPVAPVAARPAAAPASVAADPLDVAAARSVRAARLEEPVVTRRLRELAKQSGGELVGLDHRLKTFPSTRRKIASHVDKTGEAPSSYEVHDGLRYTLRVDDEPPGHHTDVVRITLGTLESGGHAILLVKNYWPRGDSYSGTNCRLRTPQGLAWELQFHTTASWTAKSKTHDDYEVMRAENTAIERKRALFRKMADAWDDVAVPEGILVDGALHASERIELIPAP